MNTPVGVVPDRVFGIRPHSDSGNIRWFFLEADRATMLGERRGVKQTSFAHKLRAYFQTWRQPVVAEFFPRFRVLTATTSRPSDSRTAGPRRPPSPPWGDLRRVGSDVRNLPTAKAR